MMEHLGYRIILSFISNLTFVLSMLVVILIAACFLGRYVVISWKLVIGALGVLVLEAVAMAFFAFNEVTITNRVIQMLQNAGLTDNIEETTRLFILGVESIIVNSLAFVYAFIFYMFSYKERKFLRSLGSVVGLYGYYMYMQTTVLYAYVYLSGGDPDIVNALTFGEERFSSLELTFQIILFAISAAVVAILYFAYYRKKKFYIIGVGTRWFFIGWLLVFTFFPTLPVAFEKVDERYYALSIIMGIMLPIVGTLAPVLLIINTSDKSLRERFAFQENYLNAELDYIEQYKAKQTETRAFRHDIINNLSMMDMLLADGKTAEAKEHLEDLLTSVSALSPEFVTGDEMLDCIVAMKSAKCKEEGIDFAADGVIDGGLNMKPMDICRVFANALDNAIEAEVNLPEELAKKILMQIKRTEQFFVIRISNTTNGRVDVKKAVNNPGYTSKKDREHHGFGITTIRKTVSDYEGMTKFEASDGEFAVSIMIPRQNS